MDVGAGDVVLWDRVRSLWEGGPTVLLRDVRKTMGRVMVRGGAEGMLSSLAVLVRSGALDLSGAGGRGDRTDALYGSGGHLPARPLPTLSLLLGGTLDPRAHILRAARQMPGGYFECDWVPGKVDRQSHHGTLRREKARYICCRRLTVLG
ncbi:hypothetical protein C8F01DRAFT_768571 [Mycena amicta]|nr:hypothetical protein C8F01DRAFT_768571 [Mycena amicta]